MTDMPYVETSTSILVPGGAPAAFALMSDMERFPSFFTGYGPIPHVVRCELATDLPVGVGTKRLITSADGSVLEEVILVHEFGKEQVYRIEKGFIPPFSWMVAAAQGHWFFEVKGDETEIRWRYRFELTSQFFVPLAGFIVHLFFKGAMRRCLRNMQVATRKE